MQGNLIGNSYNSHTSISAGRLRQFGGTSGHWGGACNLFDKNDFKEWPIKKPDLDPYILKTKKILNLKHKFFKENLSENFNIYNLVFSKVRFGDKYFNHIKKSKFIFLSLNTVFINFNGNNGYIKSITCYKKKYINLKANYYILNCGGIENPRLLLWSQFKKPELFNHRLPIGNFFMDDRSLYGLSKFMVRSILLASKVPAGRLIFSFRNDCSTSCIVRSLAANLIGSI